MGKKEKIIRKNLEGLDNASSYNDLIEFIEQDKGFELLFFKSPIPKSLADISTKKIIAVNEAWELLTGYKNHEIIGVNADELGILKVSKRQGILEKLSQNQTIKSLKAEIVAKNGSSQKVLLSFNRISLYKNDYVLTEILDITELSTFKESLKNEKIFSKNLLASLNEGLSVVDLEGAHVKVNKAFCDMTGFLADELIGTKVPHPYWPPEEYENIEKAFQQTVQGNSRHIQLKFMRKNGKRFPVSVSTSPVLDGNGKTIANLATVKDITERIQYEKEIVLAKEFSENLLASMYEGLIVVTINNEVIRVNPSFCKMTGYSEKELIGTTVPFPFWAPECYDTCIAHYSKLLDKGFHDSYETTYKRKNGKRFPVQIVSVQIKDKQGKVIAIFATIRDISEQVKANKNLEEAAKNSNLRKKTILELASLIGEDYTKALKKITSLAAKTLQVERVSIWNFNKDFTKIKCKELYTLSNDKFENGMVLNEVDNPKYFNALQKNKTLCISDTKKSPITEKFTKSYLEPFNIGAMMDVFINGSERYFGIICFEHVGANRVWTAEEEEFATSIANMVSLMIQSRDRIEAEKKLSHLNKDLSKAVTELNTLKEQLQNENIYLRNEIEMVFNFEEMVYGSAAFSDVLSNVEKVAPTKATVLLLGETGTGKELLARAIHNLSDRKDKPLIKVNCAAIPRELIESELFGHVKGSFTGAIQDKIGKVELAHNGTLFLDEIGELPIDMQPKLLRFLQEGEIEKIGGIGAKKLDVRVIAATNRDLKEDIKKNRFREDLFFRINVFPINIPALRNRQEDIPLLIEHFVDKFNKEYQKSIKYISDAAMAELQQYKWPGNIRELENLIERAIILSNSDHLVLPNFSATENLPSRNITNSNLSLNEVQRLHILKTLTKCKWKIDGAKGAAELLKIKPSTLRDRIKKLDIQRPS